MSSQIRTKVGETARYLRKPYSKLTLFTDLLHVVLTKCDKKKKEKKSKKLQQQKFYSSVCTCITYAV
jgi:GTP-binding protein EngB required for normal cell division